ncbi:MAG TPA: DUF11 domain-containing protein [Humisphaera sp.]
MSLFSRRRRERSLLAPAARQTGRSSDVVTVRRAQAPEVVRRAAWCEGLENRILFDAELVLSMSGLPSGTVDAGGTMTYTIALRNTGTDFAQNVVITDNYTTALAAGEATFLSATQLGGPTFTINRPTVGSTNPITFTIGQMNSSVPATFRVVLRVKTTALDNSTVTNTATVVRDETPPTDVDFAGDNTSSVTTTVNRRADLAVTKTLVPITTAPAPVTPGAVVAGLDATYTLTITNNGTSAAENASITDITPQYATFVSASQQSGPTFTLLTALPPVGQAGTIKYGIAQLQPGESAVFSVTLHIGSNTPDAAQVFNTATVTSDTFDPNLANNLQTIASDVEIQTDIRVVSSTDKTGSTIEGTFFPYTFTIYNAGPSDAQDVTFAWSTPNTPPPPATPGDTRPFERLVYDRYGLFGSSYDLVSGPAFTVTVPPRPPNAPRGTYTGALTTLPAGVGSTYQFWVGTPQQQDTVQRSSGGTASPDYNTANNTYTDLSHIYDAPLTVLTAPNIQGTALQPLDLQVMTFQDENQWPGNSVTDRYPTPDGRFHEMADFNASVNWGDGTASAAIISTDGFGVYRVTAQHTYGSVGQYPVTILATGDGESIALASVTALIGTVPRGGAQVANLKFTENLTETKKIGSFSRGSAAGGTTFTGTINWGDGTATSAATLTATGSGLFDVVGTHKYADQGTYTGSVSIVGSDGVTDTFPLTVVVDDLAVVATAVNVAAQTGVSAQNVAVATFTDPGGPDAVNTYNATINWGDGTGATAGTIVYNSTTQVFTVQGTHTYTAQGTYNMTVTIGHGTAPDAVVTPVATVANGPVFPALVGSPVNVTATAGTSVTVPVATFTDPDLAAPDVLANYSAVINWGDATPTSAGTITYNATTKVFTVSGTHTWAAAGTFNMTVTLQHGNSPQTVVNPVATVTLGNSISTLSPQNFTGTEGVTKTSQIVARFTTPNLAATTANFTATINWGDGTAASSGTIVKTANGQFNVVGTHLYKDDGTYTLTVGVKPTGGTIVTCTPSPIATIGNATLSGISRLFNATRNTSFNGIVGSFKDANPYDLNPAEYAVSINWGDGTAASVGTLVYNTSLARWDIRGTHTYTKVSPTGGFKLVITIVDSGVQTIKVNSTATVK